jgi:hypothetical protein
MMCNVPSRLLPVTSTAPEHDSTATELGFCTVGMTPATRGVVVVRVTKRRRRSLSHVGHRISRG